MKDKKKDNGKNTLRCPGCGKHCPAEKPRCKFGIRYFEKNAEKPESPALRKWERGLTPGGWLHSLIKVSRGLRKTLRKGNATEGELTSLLTGAEIAQLTNILEKLEKTAADV